MSMLCVVFNPATKPEGIKSPIGGGGSTGYAGQLPLEKEQFSGDFPQKFLLRDWMEGRVTTLDTDSQVSGHR